MRIELPKSCELAAVDVPPYQNRFRLLFLTVFVLSLLVSTRIVVAQTSVWEVTRGKHRIFLAGTLHALAASTKSLPAEFDDAYAATNRLMLESVSTPGSSKWDPSYPFGQTLRGHLRQESWDLVLDYLAFKGIPARRIDRYKPFMFATWVTYNEAKSADMTFHGVDSILQERATQDGRAIDQIETDARMASILSLLDEHYPDQVVQSGLLNWRSAAHIHEKAEAAWKNGDVTLLQKLMIQPIRKNFPAVYEHLLAARNRAWIDVIESEYNAERSTLIAVGVGHIVGPDALLKMLADRGFRVIQK